MKVNYKSLGHYTISGSDLEGIQEIYLDPSPNVGYIVRSLIMGLARGNTGDQIWGKLCTDREAAASLAKEWNFGSQQEVAWAYMNFGNNDRRSYQSAPFNGIIDPNHLLTDICYLKTDFDGLQTNNVEYIIQFEKVKITMAQRVLSLLSQQTAP